MSDYNSSQPIRTENDGDIVSKISDATIPSQQLKVNADGSIDTNFAPGAQIEITDGTDTLAVNGDGSINTIVTATDLDIRDLTHVSDSVKIGDGVETAAVNVSNELQTRDDDANTSLAAINAKMVDGTDIGDVTINNAVGAAAVNIQDGGNSITVDAADLDVRDLSAAQDNVAISDGTDTLAINADGSINSVVTAVDLDVRDLTHATDSVKIGDGVDLLAVNSDGSINVIVAGEADGDEIVNFNTSASVVKDTSVNHDYTVTALKSLIGEELFASASGRLKVEVKVETAAASGIFDTKFVGFNSSSYPNVPIRLDKMTKVTAGVIVRITLTNIDKAAMDVYSTLTGVEV